MCAKGSELGAQGWRLDSALGFAHIGSMAKVLFGNGVAEMRGSINGTTFSRARGGATARNRTTPVNPVTSRRQFVRSALSQYSQMWKTLTDAQRQGWADYAANVPVTNVFGQSFNRSGFNWFVAMNSMGMSNGFATFTAAPTTMSQGNPMNDPIGTISAATGELTTATPSPAMETFEAATVRISPGVISAGVQSYKGPFTMPAGWGGSALDGAVLTLPFSVAENDVVFVASRRQLPDGRYGSERIDRIVVAA